MISRSSRRANLSGSDRRDKFTSSSSRDSRRADPAHVFWETVRGWKRGKGSDLGRSSAITVLLCAGFACLFAGLVAYWFQFRVVEDLETRLTVREARSVAAKIDSVLAARVAALRMAAGSLETEHLSASGGLNRLLANLKGLFPDFRSVEIFNEQGQPLAMMGELSLTEVGKQAGLLRSSNHESGLTREPAFQDAQADDCLYFTLKHQGPDTVAWFSRARFSREAVTSQLGPHKGKRNVRLVSIPFPNATQGDPTSGASFVARPDESGKKGSSSWRTRSYVAVAPLETPGWCVTLERTIPLSPAFYLLTAIGALSVILAGLLSFAGPAPVQSVATGDEAAQARDVAPVVVPQHQENSTLQPEHLDRAPVQREAIADTDKPEMPQLELACESSAEFGSTTESSSWTRVEEPGPVSDEFLSGPAHSPEAHRADDEFAFPPDGVPGPWDAETDDGPMVREPQEPDAFACASEDVKVPLIESADEETVIVGEPILQDPIPETLEVFWNEPVPADSPAPKEQSSVRILGPW
jgi:hypothetical protein